MTNATAWDIGNTAFSSLNQTGNIKIINASVTAWQTSSHGIAAFIVFGFIILLAGMIVYIRTQKMTPTIFTTILVTLLLNYYNLLEFTASDIGGGSSIWSEFQLFNLIYLALAVGLGMAIWLQFRKKGDTYG